MATAHSAEVGARLAVAKAVGVTLDKGVALAKAIGVALRERGAALAGDLAGAVVAHAPTKGRSAKINTIR